VRNTGVAKCTSDTSPFWIRITVLTLCGGGGAGMLCRKSGVRPGVWWPSSAGLEPRRSGRRIRKGQRRHDNYYHAFLTCAGAEPQDRLARCEQFIRAGNKLPSGRFTSALRSLDGYQVALPTWTEAQAGDWLGRWAMNLTLINVSTRELRRAVRLPRGRSAGDRRMATRSRRRRARFVALTAERLAAWMVSDLPKLDLLVIQIDGLHVGTELVLVAALGTDGNCDKHIRSAWSKERPRTPAWCRS
jgi:hypothetical protein